MDRLAHLHAANIRILPYDLVPRLYGGFTVTLTLFPHSAPSHGIAATRPLKRRGRIESFELMFDRRPNGPSVSPDPLVAAKRGASRSVAASRTWIGMQDSSCVQTMNSNYHDG
jgi:hypothetical protein